MIKKNYTEIQGWCDFEDLYASVVQQAPTDQPLCFCEVGCWLGRSTGFLASLIKQYKPNIKLIVIDNFKGDGTTDFQSEEVAKAGGSIFPIFWQNMKDLQVEDVITPIEAVSWDGAAQLTDGQCDFVFIDADHKYESIKKDLVAFYPKVKQGGVFAGHDFTGETEQAVREFAAGIGKEVHRINMSWVIIKD